jgi:putative flavoprotein involved in K+ transport
MRARSDTGNPNQVKRKASKMLQRIDGNATEHIDTVVIGGGQAGLAVGYELARQGRDFVILDAHNRVGDSWRTRWDSLRLFTPASLNGLPGMPFPAPSEQFPTKDELADYLAAYAARFALPIQLGAQVDELTRDGDRYLVAAGARRLAANHVVVATGAYITPRVPAFAGQLDPAITQLHSLDYCNPGQLRDGPVLVVGAGNSGAEIALELAARRPTWLAGRDTGHFPNLFALGGLASQVGRLAVQGVKLLTVDTWLGRSMLRNARAFRRGHPLVRVQPKHLLAAGVQRVPRVVGASGGQPVLEDRRVLDVANIVWATGFVRDLRWMRLLVFDSNGEPLHHRGVVQREPGLYFIGLPFQSSLLSDRVAGVGADAKYIVEQIARRDRAAGPAYAGRLTGNRHATSEAEGSS